MVFVLLFSGAISFILYCDICVALLCGDGICVIKYYLFYVVMVFVRCVDINGHICVAMVFAPLCSDSISALCRYK